MATEQLSKKPRITNKNFRMRKSIKRKLALMPFAGDQVRAAYRRMMIEAQVAADTVVKVKKDSTHPRAE